MNKMQDPNYLLTDQYKDDTNLNARIRIHELFSTNKRGLHRWIFNHLNLPTKSNVLELGCGPGQLWLKNLDRIYEGWGITLTDFSPGMIEAAQSNLGDRFNYKVVDAQQIPFEDETFDCVIADYMLYHVPDRQRAFSEISRVLRPAGRFYAATLGRNHLKELDEMVRRFSGPSRHGALFQVEGFLLENGAEQMRLWFPHIELYTFDDALVITEPEPLIAYVLSMASGAALLGNRLQEFDTYVREELARNGAIHVTKESGLFEAAMV